MAFNEVKCKIYLEGIEIPFNSISINESIGGAATASIALPASQEALYILPKTLVHVFYKMNDVYYLIYEGSLSSSNFHRSPGQRSVQLNFSGHSTEWNRAYIQATDIDVNTSYMGSFLNVNSNAKWSGAGAGIKTKDFSAGKYDLDLLDTNYGDKGTKTNWIYNNQTLATDFLNIFTIKLNESGSLSSTISSLFSEVRSLNNYFRMVSNGLNLHSRLYVASNSKADDLLNQEQMKKLITNSITTMPSNASISMCLDLILSQIKYDWVELAAPSWDKNSKSLKQYILKPMTDYFLPIVCNLIFPDQIASCSYSRNMDAEPTRMMLHHEPLMFQNMEGADNFPNTFNYIVPSMVGWKESTGIRADGTKAEIPKMGWTYEERFRGLNTVRGEIDEPLVNKQPSDINTEGTSAAQVMEVITEDPNKKKEMQNNLNSVVKKYFDARYGARSAQVVTEYNPYRMIGFPAIVIDEIFPAIYGTIYSINSTISADGSSQQVINIGFPKLCSYEKGKDIVSGKNVLTKGLFDGIPQFPNYYSSGTYGTSVIGTNLYNTISGGESGKDYSLRRFTSSDSRARTVPAVLKEALLSLRAQLGKTPLSQRQELINKTNFRSLISEDEYWKWLGLENKPNYTGSNDAGYRKIDEIRHNNLGGVNNPFLDKRAEQVKQLMIKNNIDVIKSNIDYEEN